MKAKIATTIEVNITHVLVNLPVRYDEEDIPYDFPLRVGDTWNAKIEIDTGKIEGWPQGQTGEFYMKVVDMGSYYLLDENGAPVARIVANYVPHGVIPGEYGVIPGEYGDYVYFKIGANGVITNWPKRPDIREFLKQDEE